MTDCAPFPTPKARAPLEAVDNASAVSTEARVVPTESTVVTAVPDVRIWEIMASRDDASPTTTPDVEPTARPRPIHASELAATDACVDVVDCARAPTATSVVALPAGS